jgi:hypothetical protein
VNWSSDQDLSTGQFAVWARSTEGNWYVGQLVAATGGTGFTTDLPLTGVPPGWYQVIVAYRPTVGSGAWVSWATSYGFVFSVDAAPTPALTITAPTGLGEYAPGDTFTATWTSDPSLTTGQFAVWVRSPGNDWYWMAPLVPATGAASYSSTVDLTGVPAGLGYQVIVAYEAIANTSLWVSWATSPGVFSVDMPAPVLTVTEPIGGSYAQAGNVTATWNADTALAAGGEFGAWVRSSTGDWYATTLVPTDGGADYTTMLPLTSVPAVPGNEVIVGYRPVAGSGAFMSWATSSGSFTVTP